jgi:hypothetical protein
MTLNQYHKKVIAYRKQDLSFRFIFDLMEKEYFELKNRHKYENLTSFRQNHYKYLKEMAKRKIVTF